MPNSFSARLLLFFNIELAKKNHIISAYCNKIADYSNIINEYAKVMYVEKEN